MIITKGVPMRVTSMWSRDADPCTVETQFDSETGMCSFELPNGSLVEIPYPELKKFIDGIKRYEDEKKQ